MMKFLALLWRFLEETVLTKHNYIIVDQIFVDNPILLRPNNCKGDIDKHLLIVQKIHHSVFCLSYSGQLIIIACFAIPFIFRAVNLGDFGQGLEL